MNEKKTYEILMNTIVVVKVQPNNREKLDEEDSSCRDTTRVMI